MIKIPFNNHPMTWRGGGVFRPEGKFEVVGSDEAVAQDNPIKWGSRETWAARVIVGFKRRGKKPITMSQLVRLVRKIRLEQVGDPGATFLAQRGLYRHDAGGIVDEPGAQVVIFNADRVMPNGKKVAVTPRRFEKDIEKLSEDIATVFDQESVIVEIQKNGITQRTFGMGRR